MNIERKKILSREKILFKASLLLIPLLLNLGLDSKETQAQKGEGAIVSCFSDGEVTIQLSDVIANDLYQWLDGIDDSDLDTVETFAITDKLHNSIDFLLLGTTQQSIELATDSLQLLDGVVENNQHNVTLTTPTLRNQIPVVLQMRPDSQRQAEGVYTTNYDSCVEGNPEYSSIVTINPDSSTVIHEAIHLFLSPQACFKHIEGSVRLPVSNDVYYSLHDLNESVAVYETLKRTGAEELWSYIEGFNVSHIAQYLKGHPNTVLETNLYQNNNYFTENRFGDDYIWGPFFYLLDKQYQVPMSDILSRVLIDANDYCLGNTNQIPQVFERVWTEVTQTGVDLKEAHNLFFDLSNGPVDFGSLTDLSQIADQEALSARIAQNQGITAALLWNDPVFVAIRGE